MATSHYTQQRSPGPRRQDVRHRRRAFLIALVVFLLVAGWVATQTTGHARAINHAQPARSVPVPRSASLSTTRSSFSVITPTNTITVALGTVQTIPITLTNTTTQTMTPVLYEAWTTPPAGVSPRISEIALLQNASLMEIAQATPRVDDAILTNLAESPDGTTDFLVFLSDQADLSAAYQIEDWGERGWFVYQTLTEHARQSQQDMRAWLDARGTSYQPLWITNALIVHGNEDDLVALESREDVATLRANRTVSLDTDESLAEVSGCDADANNICWNISTIGADRVWYDFGVSGEGITVANIDSGVRYDHVALKEQYRGYQKGGTIVNDYNWFDPVLSATEPQGAGDHGTHTMGSIVARSNGTADQPAVGVAPGAEWIAARGCGSELCSESDLLEAAQWMLAPRDSNGDNPRPDLRPHIVNNSWASNAGAQTQYVQDLEAWTASGIFPVFAAGNSQSGIQCGTIVSPGDYPGVVAVGATDQSDNAASFNRPGPTWDGRIKPDIAAPGKSVSSTTAGSTTAYRSMSGTSMAAPQVAGTIALIWSANPTLIGDYDATYQVLTESALPRTDSSFDGSTYADCHADTVPNNIYGYGRLDAYAAVAAARVDVPWLILPEGVKAIPAGTSMSINVTIDARRLTSEGDYSARVLVGNGDLSQTPTSGLIHILVTANDQQATVSGNVLDETTGKPLNATIDVADGPSLSVNENGYFELTLPVPGEPQTYTITASAPGYTPEDAVVALSTNMHQTLTFSLTNDYAHISIATEPITASVGYDEIITRSVTIRNTGQQSLNYTASIPSERFGVWRNVDTGGPSLSWIDTSDGASLTLQDDTISEPISMNIAFPFGSNVYTTVRIAANGVLIFEEPNNITSFIPWCPPVEETDTGAIFPLRADLDPAQGGDVSYTRVDGGFLVTYADVPLHSKIALTFTFQVLLEEDGTVTFNYKNLSSLPTNASAGIQFSRTEVQSIGCGQDTPISSGLTLELRPQPDSQKWLSLPIASSTSGSLAPGAEETIPVQIAWVSNAYLQPYKSSVVVESNDVYNPTVYQTVLLTTGAPPQKTWLPLIVK